MRQEGIRFKQTSNASCSVAIPSAALSSFRYTFSRLATWRMLIRNFSNCSLTHLAIQKGASREKTDFSFVRDLGAFGRNGMGTSIPAERGGHHHGTLASQHA